MTKFNVQLDHPAGPRSVFLTLPPERDFKASGFNVQGSVFDTVRSTQAEHSKHPSMSRLCQVTADSGFEGSNWCVL